MKRFLYQMACGLFRQRVLEDVPGAWYTLPQPHLWAYAGGGSLRRYGNAAEDIDASIRLGFKVVEVDFACTADGVPVASHFFRPEDAADEWDHVPSVAEFKSRRVNGSYTPLTFLDLLSRYRGRDVFFSLDPFYYHCRVKGGERVFREYVLAHTTQAERSRLILQVYSFRSLLSLRGSRDWGALHYVFGGGLNDTSAWRVKPIIPLLTQVGVRSVSFQPTELTPRVRGAIAALRAANIRVSMAGVNGLAHYRSVTEAGVDCVNTMDLTPELVRTGTEA